MDTDAPAFRQVNIVARDFDASIAFYRLLGVDVPDSPPFADGIRHAEIATSDGFTLEFDSEPLATAYNARWRTREQGSRTLLGFRVPDRADVDARYADLIGAGYDGAQAPYDTFWGARYAIVVDPDGNDVGIMSPLDETKRSWPPEDSPTG